MSNRNKTFVPQAGFHKVVIASATVFIDWAIVFEHKGVELVQEIREVFYELLQSTLTIGNQAVETDTVALLQFVHRRARNGTVVGEFRPAP